MQEMKFCEFERFYYFFHGQRETIITRKIIIG